jgi:signal transduction histidine kinase
LGNNGRLNIKVGLLWIGLCAVIIGLILFRTYESQAIALSLLYTAGNVLLGFFALAMLRAQDARVTTENLAVQLKEANNKLELYSSQMKELGASRERNRLARDLHDSVTQTVFSMSLTAQSAKLLLDRDKGRLKEQLQRMEQLSQSALAEMKLLVDEMRPSAGVEGGLVSALRRYIASRRFPENFSISLEPEGDNFLNPTEEQGLFRIVLEALNNIIKHAQTSEAAIRLHLRVPFWIEVEDHGKGFDVQKALINSVGLRSMYDRATEIGWELQVTSSPGEGTRVRAQKMLSEGG